MAAPRGPGGRFLSKQERAALTNQQETEASTESASNTNTKGNNMSTTDTVNTEIEFVDELPRISRTVEAGVWVERLAPLKDNEGRWARVYGPTANPHALVNNLRSGSAAGIDPDEFSFAGRNLPTGEEDEDGEPVTEGYVFARFDTPEQRQEREQKQRERAAKRAANKAGQSDESDDE